MRRVPGQGVLVKRHRVPHLGRGDGAFIQPEDLLVGGQVALYGRTITITGADAFTRARMQQQLGITLAPDMQSPQSPHNPAHVPGETPAGRGGIWLTFTCHGSCATV